jgi:hypothetical protein
MVLAWHVALREGRRYSRRSDYQHAEPKGAPISAALILLLRYRWPALINASMTSCSGALPTTEGS